MVFLDLEKIARDKANLEKASPGEGWLFCTNTKEPDASLKWAKNSFGAEFEYKVSPKAFDACGTLLAGCSSIWRKPKETT